MKKVLISLSFLAMMVVVMSPIVDPAECARRDDFSDGSYCGSKYFTRCDNNDCCPTNIKSQGMECCRGGGCCSIGTCCGNGCKNIPTDVCCGDGTFCMKGETCSGSQCCAPAWGCRPADKNPVSRRRALHPELRR